MVSDTLYSNDMSERCLEISEISWNTEGTGILLLIVTKMSELMRFQIRVTLLIFNIIKFSLSLIKEKCYFCFTDEYLK